MQGDRRKVFIVIEVHRASCSIEGSLAFYAAKQDLFGKKPLDFVMHAFANFFAKRYAVFLSAFHKMLKRAAKPCLSRNAEDKGRHAGFLGCIAGKPI